MASPDSIPRMSGSQDGPSSSYSHTNQTKEKMTMNDNKMKHEISLQEKTICLVFTDS